MFPFRPPLLALLGLLITLPAQAAYQASITRFTLIVDQSVQTWRYPDSDSLRDTRVTRARASWTEALNPRLTGQLSLSYLDLSQTRPAALRATNSAGYGLGVGLQGTLIDARHMRMTLFGRIAYQSTRGESDGNTTERNWWDSTAGLGIDVPVGATLILQGGGGYQILSGEERFTGSGVEVLESIELDQPAYGYAGLRIELGAAGFIGLRVYAGNRQGGHIVFGNRF